MIRTSSHVIPALLVICLCSFGSQPEETKKNLKRSATLRGVELSVEIPPERPAGYPYPLHMAVTNQGSDLVTFVVVAKYKFFRLALQDGAGAEVPLTRFGKRLVAEPARRKRLTPVKPGISIGHLYDLARIFDMSEAGNYVLTVTNRVLFDSGPETLQVEKIPLVIREPTDKEYEAWK